MFFKIADGLKALDFLFYEVAVRHRVADGDDAFAGIPEDFNNPPAGLAFSATGPDGEDGDECKDGGWMTFNSPTFKNQGDCVSYVQSNSHATGNKNK